MLQAALARDTAAAAAALAILYARESGPYGDRKERKHSEAGTTIEASLKQQVAEEMELAKNLGASVREEDIHAERFTGVDSIFERPEIGAIREKIRTGKYRYLICYDTDRLARDPIHTGLIMHRMTERRRTKGKYESEQKPKSEWKVLESDVTVTPQIISKELFDDVQSLLRGRSRGRNQADA